MKHLFATVENKKPGQEGTIPAATNDNILGKKKKNFSAWHSTSPLKKSDDCHSGVFTSCQHIQQDIWKVPVTFYPLV